MNKIHILEVFNQHGTVTKLADDFQESDQKNCATAIMKKPGQWNFLFSLCKQYIVS